jgi:hypothetical protein
MYLIDSFEILINGACRKTLQWNKRYQNLLFEPKKQNRWKDVKLSCKVREACSFSLFFMFCFPLLLSFPELGSSTRTFSKSHERRMKRKAKEQLVGNMDDLQTALASLEKDIVPPEPMDKPSPSTPTLSSEVKPKAISRIGKIGKGTSSTLSKAQRKRLLYVLSLSSENAQLTIFKIIQGIGAFATPSHSS